MPVLQVYDPFAAARFDEVVRGFFKSGAASRTQGLPMKLDVIDSNDVYVVRAELPGVGKDDIEVTIDGSQVTIAAEVSKADAKDGERVLRTERYHGALYRSFVLPADLDETTSEARYDNGVLELTLRKKPVAAGRKLTIQ